MIISLYPLYKGDINIYQFEPLTCELLNYLKQAKGVILPPTITCEIYFFLKNHGIPLFPEYSYRFLYPGKIGQILLFKLFNLPHPKTIIIPRICGIEENPYNRSLQLEFPFVVKGNYGDEGKEVFLVKNERDWQEILKTIKVWELSGRFGFLIQEYIPTSFDARAIVIGEKILIFFRKGGFKKNLVQEGEPIPPPNKKIKEEILKLTKSFCQNTYFNLVAIDYLIKDDQPLFNELNFVFGRRLIGEKRYQRYLKSAIENFVKKLTL